MALDKFPVDESALPRVTKISPRRLNEWKEVARDEINRALTNRHSWYNAFKDKIRDGYDMVADRPNLKAFVRGVPQSPDKDLLIRATFDNTTLDDIAYGVYCETSYDQRCAYAHMYEENFLDAAILHTHETRTDDDPMHFVGLRWIAFRSPAPALVTSRDFVYFSYEGATTDMRGQRVLFRFLRSMPMDDVAIDASKLPPLVRGKISNLHLYRQNGPHVEAYVMAKHSNAGTMPSYVVTKTIAFMYPGITNMETIGDARALMRQGLTRLNPLRSSTAQTAAASHSPSSSSASFSSVSSGGALSMSQSSATSSSVRAAANACSVCFHKFKMTRSKRACHGCSRTVCKRCTRGLWFFDEQKQMSSTGVVRFRFCLNCIKHARSEASFSRSPSDSLMASTPGGTASRALEHGIRGKPSLSRVSSQDSMAHTPGQPDRDGRRFGHRSLSRTNSHDSMHSSLDRIPSQESLRIVPRGPRQNDSASPHTRSQQPEAEFSDEEDTVVAPPPLHPMASSKIMSFKSSSSSSSSSRPFQKTHSSSSLTMSMISSQGTVFDSSQVTNAFGDDGNSSSPVKPIVHFDSSQVKDALDESSHVKSMFESSHVGQYTGFQVKPITTAGGSEDDDEDEDFGDFHDSDSDDDDDDDEEELVEYSIHEPDYYHYPTSPPTRGGGDGEGGDDLDLHDLEDDVPDIIDVEIDYSRLTEMGDFSIVDHHGVHASHNNDLNDDLADSDDYSIAGSFCIDGSARSFLNGGEYSFGDDDDDDDDDESGDRYSDGSRGSFVPLTLDSSKPSLVAQYAFGTGTANRPPIAAPVPQLATQHRANPNQLSRPLTLRTAPPPPTVDETTEFDGGSFSELSTPPSATHHHHLLHRMGPLKSSSRTGSAPNLLAYGATKRTHRPGGVGMAPVRRAISGSGGGVIINAGSAKGLDMSELAQNFTGRVHVHDTAQEPVARRPAHPRQPQHTTTGFQSPGRGHGGAGGSTSPLIRYYGS